MNRRDVIAGIWLIGLGILFLFDFFWPGVLILIGLSMIITALMPPEKKEVPAATSSVEQVIDVVAKDMQQPGEEEPLPPVLVEKANQIYHQSLLPETCPACGGPVRQNAAATVWVDEDTAECPFCSSKLKVAKPQGA